MGRYIRREDNRNMVLALRFTLSRLGIIGLKESYGNWYEFTIRYEVK